MRKNHFIRIFVTYILIIFLGSLVTGYLSIELLKGYFVNSTQVKMMSNINVIKSSLEQNYLTTNDLDLNYLAGKYSEDIGATVTFLDIDGHVVGEKSAGLNKNIDFNKRPELVDAKKSGYGFDYSQNSSEKIYFLNIASYINSRKFQGFVHVSTPLREMNEFQRGILSYTLLGTVFVIISSGLLRFFFSKDIISPLNKIIDNSVEVRQGNLKKRVNIQADDTIGILAEEFNYMLDNLDNRINTLINELYQIESGIDSVNLGISIVDNESRITFANQSLLNMFNSDLSPESIRGHKVLEMINDSKSINLIKDTLEKGIYHETEIEFESEEKQIKLVITPIKRHDEILGCMIFVEDVTKVKRLERIGSDFVSNATHELRTPLTSIRGFVETLKNGAIEDKDVAKKFLDIIDSECERLNSLINDILQLSQIENRNQDVNLEFHYIQDIIPEVVVFLEKQAEKKDIKVSSKLQNNMPLILINKDRIKQMLINIVDNAIKYTLNGGEVLIQAFLEENNITISVKDNGIGIPEQALPRLFERFYRVDKGRSRSMGGTGLGLSIVKHIINLYKGSMDVKSKVGEGTEFIIKLPIKV